jgi:hypothetical protein
MTFRRLETFQGWSIGQDKWPRYKWRLWRSEADFERCERLVTEKLKGGRGKTRVVVERSLQNVLENSLKEGLTEFDDFQVTVA